MPAKGTRSMAKTPRRTPRRTKTSRTSTGDPAGYARRVSFAAPRERVYDALATRTGLRGWWTPRVRGSEAVGGELRFEFEGMDEYIVMRVDAAKRPSFVRWTCIVHTSLDEWNGTTLTFDLVAETPTTCTLNFRHVGLTPRLECYDDCRSGWEYFLDSLVAYVETGTGTPFGA